MVMSEGLHQNNVNYSQRPMWVESQGERSRNDYNLLITEVSTAVVITSQRCLSISKSLHTVNSLFDALFARNFVVLGSVDVKNICSLHENITLKLIQIMDRKKKGIPSLPPSRMTLVR